MAGPNDTTNPLDQLVLGPAGGTGTTKGYTEADVKAMVANGTMTPAEAIDYLSTNLKIAPQEAKGKVDLWQQSFGTPTFTFDANGNPIRQGTNPATGSTTAASQPDNPLGDASPTALKAAIKAGQITQQQAIGARINAGRSPEEAALDLGLNPNMAQAGGGGTGGATGGGGGNGGGAGTAVAKKDAIGNTFSVKQKDGSVNQVREYRRADGSSYYVNLNTLDQYDKLPTSAADAPPPRKLSRFEQEMQSAVNGQRILSGGPQGAAPAPASPTANPAMQQTAPPEGVSPPIGTAPVANYPSGSSVASSAWIPTGDGSGLASSYLDPMTARSMLGAGGMKATNNPEADMGAALGLQATRARMQAENPNLTPGQIQSMIEQANFAQAHPEGGGNPNFNTGYVNDYLASTTSHNASGHTAYVDANGRYQELLDPNQAAADGADFNTQNPIMMVDMVTKQPLGMVGGTGREKISVTPQGPHGSNEMEAMVGSRMWPQATGVKTAAGGADINIEDLLKNPNATIDTEGAGRPSMLTAASQVGLPANETVGVDNRPNAANWPAAASTTDTSRAYDTSTGSSETFGRGNSNGGYYDKSGGIGAIGSYMWDPHDIPGSIARKASVGWGSPDMPWDQMPATNDAWTQFVRSHPNDPLTRLPARLLPREYLRSPEEQQLIYGVNHPGQGWLDPRGGYANEGVTMADGGDGMAGVSQFDDTMPDTRNRLPQQLFNPDAVLDPSQVRYGFPIPDYSYGTLAGGYGFPFNPNAWQVGRGRFSEPGLITMGRAINPFADGGSGTAGGYSSVPGDPNGVYRNIGHSWADQNAGASFGQLDNWASNWQNLTPQQQNYAYLSERYGGVGMGTPFSGNSWLPPITFSNAWQNNGTGPGYLSQTTGAVPLPYDAHRELGLSPFSTNQPARFDSVSQFMNTPINQMNTTATSGTPTFADGGMGTAGGMQGPGGGAVSSMMAPVPLPPTTPEILKSVAQMLTMKTGYKAPFGAMS